MLWWTQKQLRSKDRATRCKAILTLAKDPKPAAAELLVQALKDSDVEARSLAARALAERKDPNAFVALLPLCADPDPKIGLLIVSLLTHALWHPRDDVDRAWLAVGTGDLRSAGRLGLSAFPALTCALSGGSPQRTKAAIEALSLLPGEKVLATLKPFLDSSDQGLRTSALEAIGRIGGASAAELILPLLNDPANGIRVAALEALGRTRSVKACDRILPLLDDPYWDVRRAAIITLGVLREVKAVPRLVQSLEDADRDVREAAVQALSALRVPDAFGPLVMALVDPDQQIRKTAEFALSRLDRNWIRSPQIPTVVPQLRRAMRHHDYWVGVAATRLLEKIVRCFPDLDVPELAQVASPAAGGGVVAALVDLLQRDDVDLRFAAVEALKTISSPQATDALEHAVFDLDPEVKALAERAVAALKSQGLGSQLAPA